jgi:hypothetical protein
MQSTSRAPTRCPVITAVAGKTLTASSISYLAGDDLCQLGNDYREAGPGGAGPADLRVPGSQPPGRALAKGCGPQAGHLEEQFRISNSDLDNPIGTLWGHIQAWRRIKEYRLQLGIAL